MSDRAVLRAGAGAAIAGAVLGFVFNLLHPRPSSPSVGAELRMVAGSDIWRFDHFMLMWSIGLTLIGLVVIGRSFAREPGPSWGRVANAAAIAGGAVALVTVFADGMAGHDAAAEWAKTQSEVSLATATAVGQVTLAMFTALIFIFFGVTPVLYGVAILSSGEYPKWLGYLPLASGLLGLVTASIQFLAGVSQLTANVLFPVSSLVTTIWLFLMGVQLWRWSRAPAPTSPGAASAGRAAA